MFSVCGIVISYGPSEITDMPQEISGTAIGICHAFQEILSVGQKISVMTPEFTFMATQIGFTPAQISFVAD